jgi:hypothetical protein
MIMKIRANLTLVMFLTGACDAQNLLTNGDFSVGNTGFSSGYAYIASGGSSSPGTYGIRTNSQDFNSAYTSFYDHTTGNGNMLLFDGSPGTTTIAWTETVSVMTNAQYTYSCWATSSDPYNVPTLQFFINGIQVGSQMALSTNSGQWQQFLAGWNSGATNRATLSVVDENPAGYAYGNDFALDDFSFSIAQPSLSIALSNINSAVISWPSPATGFVLQQNADLTTTNWTTNSDPIITNNGTNSITITPPRGNSFFRLWHP